jgi:hypothetical protein
MNRRQFQPGDSILFQRGGIWYEELIIPSGVNGAPRRPITLGNYGSGPLPVIEGGSNRAACISAVYVNVSYITIDGFECRNTTQYAINFNAGSPLPGIVIKNNYVHNTGPGACTGCGRPYDDNHYRNQVNFEIDHAPSLPSGVLILDNTVAYSGGHNAIQVHMDSGSPVVRGNLVFGYCVHNCIDLKGVVNATVDRNMVTNANGPRGSAGIYTENTGTPAETITISRNIVYNTSVGIQIESGTSSAYPCEAGPCGITAAIYNNTVYRPGIYSFISTSCSAAPFSFTVKNNIFDGGAINLHSGCAVVWDYNNDGGSGGFTGFSINGRNYYSIYGAHDLYRADPSFINPAASPPNFALGPSSPCRYAGVKVGLPYTGRAPSMGALDPGLTRAGMSYSK